VKKKRAMKAKSVRSLSAKALDAKNAKGVKGGSTATKTAENPTESIGFNYGNIKWKY